MPMPHEGTGSASPEEVEGIVALVANLTGGDVHWTDHRNDRRALMLSDILIVAPYNAQVAALCARLPEARIGTVDKFRGQEAPVVICSLTTSSPEEAPRGMAFLYSPNRLNVAVSRAKARASWSAAAAVRAGVPQPGTDAARRSRRGARRGLAVQIPRDQAHDLLVAGRCGRARACDPAVTQDHDAVNDHEDMMDVVTDQDAGVAGILGLADETHDAISLFDTQVVGGLIHDDEVGLEEHRPGDGDGLPFTPREFSDGRIGVDLLRDADALQ
jgi:hypothetical protein